MTDSTKSRRDPRILDGCPCYGCKDRGSDFCDHGIRCQNGFATWKILFELHKMRVKKRKEEAYGKSWNSRNKK